jgi:serine/threonine protein kinase
MKPNQWRRVDEVFAAALELEPSARAAFLDRACGSDRALHAEVIKMLAYDEQAGDFIQTGIFDVATRLLTDSQLQLPSSKSGSAKPGNARSGQSYNSNSIEDARFVSGDILAERYRIVGLLGRGGMGEVYRADDLKLKESVALKFLPESISKNSSAIDRFYKEVSVARQISHRHVCRVYDVAEFAGQHFISMEFVRGEELSSLLKRIGLLPQAKAIEVARQLCAGLAAVHQRGVLHRDLKPANIMLDEHGDVRITDFGIAALAEEVERDATAGTPAYMSPEQLEGEELTIRSDLYSLGLVLYEVFTGRKAFEAANLPELLRMRRSNTAPTSPSEYVPELDPMVEQVIFRCLEKTPDRRPSSALQVAAGLPGGDPLSAALAAGEIPSPEMVAAAPKEGGLRPAVAVALLSTFLVLLITLCFLSRYTTLYQQVPLEKPPEVLRDRAAELTRKLGYQNPPGDSSFGIGVDEGYLNYIKATDQSSTRWARLGTGQPAAIYFWYRQSVQQFDVSNGDHVKENTPAPNLPGMTTITLDTKGRLRSFSAVPPARTSGESVAVDWSPLFTESGLSLTAFQPVTPVWTPPSESTERAAWEGVYPNQPDIKLHIEAAAFEGKPVHFEIYEPWDQPVDPQFSTETFRQRALTVVLLAVFITVMVGSGVLALRNARLGRGDRRGAFRLAAFLLAVFFLRWLLTSHHVSTAAEAFSFIENVKSMLFWTFFFWVVYMAFEPFVRKLWPERIISWNRVLAGGFRDPLVGRDVLIGIVFGLGALLCNFFLSDLFPRLFGYPPAVPWFDYPATQLLGLGSLAFGLMQQIFGALMQPFMLLFFLLLLYIILRRERLAAFALWVIMSLTLSLTHETLLAVPFACVSAFLMLCVLYRFGLLSLIAATYVLHLVIFFPFTSEFTAWYAADFVVALGGTLVLAGFSFYTSLAGRPIFRSTLLD